MNMSWTGTSYIPCNVYFASNLSPLKIKTRQGRLLLTSSLETNLPPPLPVFRSPHPHKNMVRESDFAKRDETNEAGSDIYEQNETAGQADENGVNSVAQIVEKVNVVLMAKPYRNCIESSRQELQRSVEETTQNNRGTRRHLQFEPVKRRSWSIYDTYDSQHANSRLAVDYTRSTSFELDRLLGRASIIQQPARDSQTTTPHHSFHEANTPDTNTVISSMVRKRKMDGSLSTHEVSLIQDIAKDPIYNPSQSSIPFEQGSSSFTRALSDSKNADRYKESNQLTSQKKRRRAPVSGKKCHCKRSKCLKLYCECFASGSYCLQSCACEGCLNISTYEDTVLDTRQKIESRNPHAFVSKVVEHGSDSPANSVATPSSARHIRGCNCKKSMCLKKYCECLQMGVGCSDECRCDGCKNSFGTKKEMRYTKFELREGRSHEQLDTAPVNKLRSSYPLGNHYLSPGSAYLNQEWYSNKVATRRDIFSSTREEIPEYGHISTPLSDSYPGTQQQENNYSQSSTHSLGWSRSSISHMPQTHGPRMRNDDTSEIFKDTFNVMKAAEVSSDTRVSPPCALDPSPVFENTRTYNTFPSVPPLDLHTPDSNQTSSEYQYPVHPNDSSQ